MRCIAIDLGNKRCGIALEFEGKIAIPKKIVSRVTLIYELKIFFTLYKDITTIIVGLPYDLYGKDFTQLNKTNKFIEKLKDIFPEKEVIGIDERFTSFSAENTLDELGLNKSSKKDDISASIILETYLNKIN